MRAAMTTAACASTGTPASSPKAGAKPGTAWPAKWRLAGSCASARMLTPNRRAVRSRACIRALLPTDTTTRGGSSDPDMNAFAVIAWGARRGPVDRTMTPVVKRPSAPRKKRLSKTRTISGACSARWC